MFRPGDKVGPYTLVNWLGAGGFGEVRPAEKRTAFEAHTFAIKLPFNAVDAVRKEVRVWKQVHGHPNVLSLIEADIYDGQIALVSEYAPDGSLSRWLKSQGGCAPSPLSAMTMTVGILAGLEHLHGK